MYGYCNTPACAQQLRYKHINPDMYWLMYPYVIIITNLFKSRNTIFQILYRENVVLCQLLDVFYQEKAHNCIRTYIEWRAQ